VDSFFDLLEKRGNVWRIVKRTAVYEKDRMDSVDPQGVPKDFFADMNLSAFLASAKFLCYWQLRSGRPPSTDIAFHNKPCGVGNGEFMAVKAETL
jgi:hypothetical protein